jgi:hypothetical protein
MKAGHDQRPPVAEMTVDSFAANEKILATFAATTAAVCFALYMAF